MNPFNRRCDTCVYGRKYEAKNSRDGFYVACQRYSDTRTDGGSTNIILSIDSWCGEWIGFGSDAPNSCMENFIGQVVTVHPDGGNVVMMNPLEVRPMPAKDDGTQVDRPQVGEMSEEMANLRATPEQIKARLGTNPISDAVIRDLQSKERCSIEKRVRDYATMLGRCANKIMKTDPEFANNVFAIIDRGDLGYPICPK